MADDTDRAQETEARIRAEALAVPLAAIRFAASMPGLTECEDCTDPIGADRLKANPHARRCISCQTVWESK